MSRLHHRLETNSATLELLRRTGHAPSTGPDALEEYREFFHPGASSSSLRVERPGRATRAQSPKSSRDPSVVEEAEDISRQGKGKGKERVSAGGRETEERKGKEKEEERDREKEKEKGKEKGKEKEKGKGKRKERE